MADSRWLVGCRGLGLGLAGQTRPRRRPSKESLPVPIVNQLVARIRGAADVLLREVMKFGAVGAIAFVVDIGIFNLALIGFGDGGPVDGHPKIAKVISATVATLVAWLGNRFWTFRHRPQNSPRRELLLFVAFNLAGMAIAITCQAISHDILGYTSHQADNISANGVGLILGTLFRFWAYRTFVFPNALARLEPESDPANRDDELGLPANLAKLSP